MKAPLKSPNYQRLDFSTLLHSHQTKRYTSCVSILRKIWRSA